MEENGKNKHACTLHIYSSSDTAYLLNRPINKNSNLEKLRHAKCKLTQPVIMSAACHNVHHQNTVFFDR